MYMNVYPKTFVTFTLPFVPWHSFLLISVISTLLNM